MQLESGSARRIQSELLAILLSLLIISCSLVGFLAGVYGLIRWYTSPLLVIVCLSILLISWLSRPRFIRFPKHARSISHSSHPKMHEIMMRIQNELGITKHVDYAVSPYYEAYTTEIGWRRTPIVVIGYPLFFVCTPEEMTAIIAHELAHCRNEDVRRKTLVALALHILANWCDMLDPSMHEAEGILSMIAKWFMGALYWIPLSLLILLVHLFWNQSQRAEYEADRLAAQVCGSDAISSALLTTHLEHVYEMILGKYALQKQEQSLRERLHEAFSTVPATERTRVHRILERSGQSMDTTHPATHMRIAMMQGYAQNGSYQLSSEDYELMCEELSAQFGERMEHQIIDSFRAYHY